MKTLQDGTIKLSKNEKKVGNFIVKMEETHMKVTDLNGLISVRIKRTMVTGMLLESLFTRMAKEDDARDSLHNYATVLFNFLCVLPDAEFWKESIRLCNECYERHASFYGAPADGTDEDHEEALNAIREEEEFRREILEAERKESE